MASGRGPAGTALRLGEVEPVDLRGVAWRPLLRALGVRAFGVNAHSRRTPARPPSTSTTRPRALRGASVTSSTSSLAGEAAFTVAGEAIAAPAGTLVFVRDPAARRGAVALRDGTRVLAVGAPVGEPYEPGPWERWHD